MTTQTTQTTQMTQTTLAGKIWTRCALALLLLGATGANAWAQSSQFTLSDQGEWTQERAPEPGTDEAVIADASALLASNQPSRAFDQIDRWIGEHEETNNQWLPRAYLLRGDALVALNDEFEAMYDYERQIIQKHPQSEEFVRAIERELDIAIRYAHGLRRKFLGVRMFHADDIAEETFIRVQERLPGSSLAEQAAIELANLYYRQRDLGTAAIAYDLYIENFPNGSSVAFAMERRIRANVAKYKGPDYDGSSLIDAREQTQIFQRTFPSAAQKAGLDDRLVQRLDDAAADQMLQGARWYLKRRDQTSAQFTLRRVLRRHPDSPAAAHALKLLLRHGWDRPTPADNPDAPAMTPDSKSNTNEESQ